MHPYYALYSLLLASSTLATPLRHLPRQSNGTTEVTVTLSGDGDAGATVIFDNVHGTERESIGTSSIFTQVTVDVAADAANQDLRCQVLNRDGNPLIATRGTNIDIAFSDGDGGPWTFVNAAGVSVSEVVCDPAFVKVEDPSTLTLSVVLQNQGSELGTTTPITVFGEPVNPLGSSGPYETVEIVVPEAFTDQELRCALLDKNGDLITAVRGDNKDTTFSDAGKGVWTFVQEAEVDAIVCDPAFEADPVKKM